MDQMDSGKKGRGGYSNSQFGKTTGQFGKTGGYGGHGVHGGHGGLGGGNDHVENTSGNSGFGKKQHLPNVSGADMNAKTTGSTVIGRTRAVSYLYV